MKDFDINDCELVKMTYKERADGIRNCHLCCFNYCDEECAELEKCDENTLFYYRPIDPRTHKGEDKRAGWGSDNNCKHIKFYVIEHTGEFKISHIDGVRHRYEVAIYHPVCQQADELVICKNHNKCKHFTAQ